MPADTRPLNEYQTRSDALDAQNPAVVANTDLPIVINGSTVLVSPGEYIQHRPRVNASCTGTISGAVADGDVITVTATNGTFPGGEQTVMVTAGTVDTATTLAQAIAAAFTNNLILQQRDVTCTSAGPTFTLQHQGPVGNYTTLTFTSTGAETIAFTNGGQLTGGSGPITPLRSFNMMINGQMKRLRYFKPEPLSYELITQLVRTGSPIK